jgi:hypothetical protein
VRGGIAARRARVWGTGWEWESVRVIGGVVEGCGGWEGGGGPGGGVGAGGGGSQERAGAGCQARAKGEVGSVRCVWEAAGVEEGVVGVRRCGARNDDVGEKVRERVTG